MVEARKPTLMMMGNLGRGRKTTVNSVLSELPEENFPQGQNVQKEHEWMNLEHYNVLNMIPSNDPDSHDCWW